MDYKIGGKYRITGVLSGSALERHRKQLVGQTGTLVHFSTNTVPPLFTVRLDNRVLADAINLIEDHNKNRFAQYHLTLEPVEEPVALIVGQRYRILAIGDEDWYRHYREDLIGLEGVLLGFERVKGGKDGPRIQFPSLPASMESYRHTNSTSGILFLPDIVLESAELPQSSPAPADDKAALEDAWASELDQMTDTCSSPQAEDWFRSGWQAAIEWKRSH